MIRIIKFLAVWVILVLALFAGGWIASFTIACLSETFGVLEVVGGILVLAIGGTLAFVAWQIVEE